VKTSLNYRFKRGQSYRCPECGKRGIFGSSHVGADCYQHAHGCCVVMVPEKERFFRTAQDTIEAVTGHRPGFVGQLFLPFRYGWDKGITQPNLLIRDFLKDSLKFSVDLVKRHHIKIDAIELFLKNGQIICPDSLTVTPKSGGDQ